MVASMCMFFLETPTEILLSSVSFALESMSPQTYSRRASVFSKPVVESTSSIQTNLGVDETITADTGWTSEQTLSSIAIFRKRNSGLVSGEE